MTERTPRQDRTPFLIFDAEHLRQVRDAEQVDPLTAPMINAAGRMELLRIWRGLSDEGRRFVLITARAKAQEERQR